MATLKGMGNIFGKKWLSLTPVSSDNQSFSSYEYILRWSCGEDENVAEIVYSVAGWQSEHEGPWLLARTFIASSALEDATTKLKLLEGWREEPTYYCYETSFLNVVINRPYNNRVSSLNCRFYIEVDEKKSLYERFFLKTTFEAAKEFGCQLEQEIITAHPEWWKNHYGAPKDCS